MNHLIAIVGPTGVGKTSLAVSLARDLYGEVIGADSRQVYRSMDIGTGKPTLEQRAAATHHLVDVVAPDEPFTLAQYAALARATLEDVWKRGKLPFLVGGTGLYVWALLEGWQVPQVPPNHRLRQELEDRAAHGETGKLFAELAQLDPGSACIVDSRNPRRVIRALEICLALGQPLDRSRRRETPPFSFTILGLTTSRQDLYQRIDARVDDMIKEGWLEEVRGLLDRGYAADLPA